MKNPTRQCEFCRHFKRPSYADLPASHMPSLRTMLKDRSWCEIEHTLRNSDFGYRRKCEDYDEDPKEAERLTKLWAPKNP